MPTGKTIIHATLDPADINKDVPVALGRARRRQARRCAALIDEVSKLHGRSADAIPRPVAKEIKDTYEPWLAKWMPKLTHNEAPLNRPIACCGTCRTRSTSPTPSSRTTPAARATSSRRSGAARRRSPTSAGARPRSSATGLGLAMGAKLAKPDKLCINVWGDAAIGFTGMDFETAVRERIPILSILLNNFSMAIELQGDAGLDREVSLDRHLRRLRGHGARASAATASASRSPATSSRRSSAASRRPRRASRRCSSSSPPRKSTSPGCEATLSSRGLPALGLVPRLPGIHPQLTPEQAARWIPGMKPGMTSVASGSCGASHLLLIAAFRATLAILGLSLAGAWAPAAAQTAVDLQLVLAVDASGSVSEQRFELQKQGYVAAFRSPLLLRAMRSRRHAVDRRDDGAMDRPAMQVEVVPWRLVNDEASMLALRRGDRGGAAPAVRRRHLDQRRHRPRHDAVSQVAVRRRPARDRHLGRRPQQPRPPGAGGARRRCAGRRHHQRPADPRRRVRPRGVSTATT